VLERITWFWQSAIRWAGDGLTVYVDPRGVSDDDPPGDLILITHAHEDHFLLEDLERVRGSNTTVVAPRDVADGLTGDVTAVTPGESHEIGGVRIATVPAYNVAEERLQMHPKENGWVGYVLELGGTTYYHAGDTDHVPELEEIRTDVAFLPIGGTYTMDVPEAAGLARAMEPGLAVPFHYAFVVGSRGDGERFREEAAPVPVELMTPVRPFELD
jgi:L-ascorbate metabolism protein UlaG (beta-lactamase superfamily)